MTNKKILLFIFLFIFLFLILLLYLNYPMIYVIFFKNASKFEKGWSNFYIEKAINLEKKYDKNLPKYGHINDHKKAIKIAEKNWFKIYGKNKIISERPYQVELLNNKYWIVCGTLPKGYKGGTAVIIIRKKDGQVLGIWHEK